MDAEHRKEADGRLEALVQQVRDLPALPEIAIKVAHLVDDPRSSAPDIAKALSADQAITVRVLKIANSAFYGATRKISTVTDAVVLLGMRTVRNLAMVISCQEMLKTELSGYILRRGDLWQHSFCCAYAAQSLARRAHYRAAEEAFVGGLLHDIGKVVMNVHLEEQFRIVFDHALNDHLPFMEAERDVLGFDHAEAGARVLEKWNLPAPLVQAVRFHHEPLSQTEFSPLTGLVHIADILCVLLGIGIGGDGLIYPLQSEVLDKLGLTTEDFEQVASQVAEIVSQSETIF